METPTLHFVWVFSTPAEFLLTPPITRIQPLYGVALRDSFRTSRRSGVLTQSPEPIADRGTRYLYRAQSRWNLFFIPKKFPRSSL